VKTAFGDIGDDVESGVTGEAEPVFTLSSQTDELTLLLSTTTNRPHSDSGDG